MRRFSIAAMMTVVLICGVAVAALKQASDAWAGGLLMLTLALLGAAVFGIVYRREARRAWWLGFAVFGWGYLALAMGPWCVDQIAPKLPTTQLLAYLHARLNPEVPHAPGMPPGYPVGGPPSGVTFTAPPMPGSSAPLPPAPASPGVVNQPIYVSFWIDSGNVDKFTRVGHCLFALLAAVAGGLIARGFQRSNREAMAGAA